MRTTIICHVRSGSACIFITPCLHAAASHRLPPCIKLSVSRVQTAVVNARRKLLDKLPALYEEQHALGMAVMGSMLPQPQQLADTLPGVLTSAPDKVEAATAWGLGRAQLRTGATVIAMNALWANVLREQSLQRQLLALLLHEVRSRCDCVCAAALCASVNGCARALETCRSCRGKYWSLHALSSESHRLCGANCTWEPQ